jgi:polysaccharide export outer membrane protein
MAARGRGGVSGRGCSLFRVGFLALLVLVALPASAEEYAVGAGDILQITVFDHPDLQTTAQVSREGQIRFPLIGQVPVKGLSVPQVVEALTAALANGYLIDPQVSVTVQEFRKNKSSVIGKVNRPGQYEFQGHMTFLELLSRAGGLAPDAGSQAVIRRKSASEAIRAGDLVIDLKALIAEGDTYRDIEILDGDTVTVTEAGTVFLTGEVRRPGEYRFEEGMTLIRALTLAGGFTERAAADQVRIIRSEEGREVVIDVSASPAGLEQPVRRSDVVVVKVARAEVCYVTGEVKNAGAYRCEKDTSVLKAVTLAGGFTDAAAKGKIRIIRRVGGQEQVREKVGLDEVVAPDDVIIVPKTFF